MPYATFSTPVNASLNTLWTVLLNKIEAPEKYMMGVEDVQILEEFENGVVRKVTTPDMELSERIQINAETGEVIYTLIDHPLFSGDVINKVTSVADAPSEPPVLNFTVDWQAKNQEAKQLEELYAKELAQGMEQAALYIKGLAEHLETKNRAPDMEAAHHHHHHDHSGHSHT